MSNLHGRALEDEYLGIMRDLGGDAEGREIAASYLASAHPVANREGMPTWSVTPKILCSAELGILRDAAETMGRILERVTARFLSDKNFRARFCLPEEAEALSLVPTGYEQLIPFARIDVLFDEGTGDFTVVGAATDSSLGMTASVEVTRAAQLTETYRRFAELHPEVETFDVTGGVIDALCETLWNGPLVGYEKTRASSRASSTSATCASRRPVAIVASSTPRAPSAASTAACSSPRCSRIPVPEPRRSSRPPAAASPA